MLGVFIHVYKVYQIYKIAAGLQAAPMLAFQCLYKYTKKFCIN